MLYMYSGPSSSEEFNGINPSHIGLLEASLRAPSAHNAQPWQIRPLDDGRTYEIHYDQSEGLPEDVDNKDAYLTMGAFVETMVLEAPNHGFSATVSPELTRDGRNLFIARVALDGFTEGDPVDPLSKWVGQRHTNRNHYEKDPLPVGLEAVLRGLGNTIVETKDLKDVLLEASNRSWANPRYVDDLSRWFRKDEHAPDGLTGKLMHLSRLGMLALDLAFWRRGFKSSLMQNLYSSSEVSAFTSAPKAVVLGATAMTPEALFDAGRRLLRSWVEITAAGYSYQPYSVAVDDKLTAPKVGALGSVDFPVALYRVGKSAKAPRISNRRPLNEVLIK